MIGKFLNRSAAAAIVFSVSLLIAPSSVRSHCDGMDGPVVRAAKEALAKGDVTLVLIWVPAEDENAIRAAFQNTLAVRKLGPQARELADMYFFETLVRIHRAGEGAPYTGLKPAGMDLGPAIPAADRAVETGELEPVLDLILESVRGGLTDRFSRVNETKGYSKKDVVAGRKFVERYVSFIHYVEGVYEAARGPAAGHHPESKRAAVHDHD